VLGCIILLVTLENFPALIGYLYDYKPKPTNALLIRAYTIMAGDSFTFGVERRQTSVIQAFGKLCLTALPVQGICRHKPGPGGQNSSQLLPPARNLEAIKPDMVILMTVRQ
jgi:hypothetical protein